MKIILLKSIKNLGNPGDTANVKKGYARNYLIPNKMAVYATETNLVKVENQVKKAQEFEVKNNLVKYISRLYPNKFIDIKQFA